MSRGAAALALAALLAGCGVKSAPRPPGAAAPPPPPCAPGAPCAEPTPAPPAPGQEPETR